MTVQDVDSDTQWLPDEIQYGYVADRVLRAIGDTNNDDDRYPDGVPARGTIRFEPERSIKYTSAQPATVIKDAIECTIYQGDEDGEDNDRVGLLVDPAGHVGNVALIAGWYQVTYRLDSGSVPRFRIHVTPEHTVDDPLWLPRAAPITPAPSERFVVNEQVYRDTLTARDKTKDYRNETLTARDQAQTAATSSADSAGGAKADADRAETEADRAKTEREATETLGITVDTSVGTRVFVGDTMIHGDTGWRDVSDLFDESVFTLDQNLSIARMRRTTNTVEIVFRGNIAESLVGVSDSASRSFLTVPSGYAPSINHYGVVGSGGSSVNTFTITNVADARILSLRGFGGTWPPNALSATVIYPTDDPWPTSLPGTPG